MPFFEGGVLFPSEDLVSTFMSPFIWGVGGRDDGAVVDSTMATHEGLPLVVAGEP